MNIFVDIDDTICTLPDGWENGYDNAQPIPCRIKRINDLYDKGHIITYWTARGTSTKKDWRKATENQLRQWGVKYHTLLMKKPLYDMFIDDRNFNSEFYFNDKYDIKYKEG